jgi:hypothetical protein
MADVLLELNAPGELKAWEATRNYWAAISPMGKKDDKRSLVQIEQDDYDQQLFWFAMVPPVIAATIYPLIVDLVTLVTDLGTWSSGRNVDGNQFATTMLQPTLNGIVVPMLSIGLGTLLATTVNVLRQRQEELRAYINKEAGTKT